MSDERNPPGDADALQASSAPVVPNLSNQAPTQTVSHGTDVPNLELTKYGYDREQEVSQNQFTHALEVEQLRLLILLNGGAATALLAFAGETSARATTPWLVAIASWLLGLVLGAAATMTLRYVQSKHAKFYRLTREAAETRNHIPSASVAEDPAKAREQAKFANCFILPLSSVGLFLFIVGAAAATIAIRDARESGQPMSPTVANVSNAVARPR